MPTALFRVENSVFHLDGETTWNGTRAAEFGFRVPAENGHYTYVERQQRVITGYYGTLLADPQTDDLVRLIVRTNRDGTEVGNRAVLSGCREFRGESRITFDTPVTAAASSGRRIARVPEEIPSGVTFRVAIVEPIDTTTAAAGDRVSARLLTAIEDHRKVLAPKGAIVQARIARISRYYGLNVRVELDLQVEGVQAGGSTRKLIDDPDEMSRFAAPSRGRLRRSVQLGSLRGLEEHAAAFIFRDAASGFVVPAGMQSAWITRSTSAGSEDRRR